MVPGPALYRSLILPVLRRISSTEFSDMKNIIIVIGGNCFILFLPLPADDPPAVADAETQTAEFCCVCRRRRFSGAYADEQGRLN